MAQDNQEFIKVNRILGKQASIGPIPAEQLVPWIAIIVPTFRTPSVTIGYYGGKFMKKE
ncbi:hypothetical protein ANSO36C_67000 (plasmid) [Nostoc cf. commune SO-36]|uniref:Uncharacterized protein n=1 Tax=Nostoc cf. commune SO-36 TaxID=449208 RepID=A0ABM7ZCA3_NOSCO|nr:hypothetical protein [Nostoc commune]BDI20898.1 hypothetical protein ANSO36C_67000 [Nostoc cf. commune SO-36]